MIILILYNTFIMFDDGKLLEPSKMNNKILGIICGIYKSENKSAIEQLNILLDICICGKSINHKSFIDRFKKGNYCIDDHSSDVLKEKDLDINILKSSYSCNRKKCILKQVDHINEIPLLRIPFIGLFKDWRKITIDICCSTHFTEDCIACCWLLNSFIRTQIKGYGDEFDIEAIKNESIDYIMFGGKMVNKECIDNMMYFTNKIYILRLINI